MTRKVDVAIIGSGSAGLNALGQVRKAKKSFVLINGGPVGTTCARVGCMPSKVAIQTASDFHRRDSILQFGIHGGEKLSLNRVEAMEHVRQMRDFFVGRVTSQSTDKLGTHFVNGYAKFLSPNTLKVGDEIIETGATVIATGSSPIIPEPWRGFGDRVLTTDTFFEQEKLPDRIAVIGLGVIGLELGQTLSRWGVEVTGIDALPSIGGIQDPEVLKVAMNQFSTEFPIWTGHPAEIQQEGSMLSVRSGDRQVLVDKVLVCIGRRPNLKGLGLEAAGVDLDERGIPVFHHETMQLGNSPIFLAGDVTGDRATLHEAADEGKIAGYNASHPGICAFKRKTHIGITFTDPNLASVGLAFHELPDHAISSSMNFAMQARARMMGKRYGILKIYASGLDGTLLGASVFTPHGEHLAHLLAWCVQSGMMVSDLQKMPYYHPVLEEGLQNVIGNLAGQLNISSEPIAELVLKHPSDH